MLYSLSNLEMKDLNTLRQLEHAMGKSILAFSSHNVRLADLTPEQLNSVKKVEEELGLILIVTDTQSSAHSK